MTPPSTLTEILERARNEGWDQLALVSSHHHRFYLERGWVESRIIDGELQDGDIQQIATCVALKRLALPYARIGSPGARLIASSLPQLTHLDLDSNDIGPDGAQALGSLSNLTYLDLDSNDIGLDGVKALGPLTNLTYLSLSNNDIGPDGAKALSVLTNLTFLFLRGNDIGPDGAKALSVLTNLVSLGLSSNNIGPNGAKALTNLTNLTVLDLDSNGIGPDGAEVLSPLTGLISLHLSHNSIGPDGAKALGSLTNLTSLHLSNNNIGPDGAKALGSLTNLTSLYLSNNNIGPDGATALGSLTNLTSLYLSNNNIGSDGAKALTHLTRLTSIDLSDNNVGPGGAKALTHLTSLTSLDLSDNDIGPDGAKALSHLTNLSSLDLSYNSIGADGAKALNRLTDLTFLNLAGNDIGPDGATALHPHTSLTFLHLRGNDLGPDGVKALSSLTNLAFLDLANNGIGADGAKALSPLTNLTSLDLSANDIGSDGAKALSPLTNLKSLALSDNAIGIDGVKALAAHTQLQALGLAANQLTSLPPEFGYLTSLWHIDLDNNPLNPEIKAAYDAGQENLLAYLRELDNTGTRILEAKLVVVGEGKVGKSSLLGALRGDPWIENRDTTHGIEIKPIRLPHTSEPAETITLNGWDFGGQPVYRPTHQIFFTAPALYLVVWKPRTGPEQGFVEYWLDRIRMRAGSEARVFVVATHGGPKERQAHIDRQTLHEAFPGMIVGFFHVESYGGGGIAELKRAIASAALALPATDRLVPRPWLDVRQRLQSFPQPYIRYRELEKICAEHGMDELGTSSFTSVHHVLGLLLHHAIDPHGDNKVILRADWLSKAISFVLEDAETKACHGLLRHDRLRSIWNDPDKPVEECYPNEVHGLFLNLMQRYDLCYPVEDSRFGEHGAHASLVAQLVDGERPSFDWSEISPGEQQLTQVCEIVDRERGKPVEADGLFYRLIVRLHRHSLGRDHFPDSRHWQKGLVLADPYGNRALLEYVGPDVRVSVRGVYPIHFLHQLTSVVKDIVEEFWPGLLCRIMVPCGSSCEIKRPGHGRFELPRLIESLRQGRKEFPCMVPSCQSWQPIDELMHNAPTSDTSNTELHEKIDRILANTQGTQDSLTTIKAQLAEQFTTLYERLDDDGKHGPRLFSMATLEPGFLDKPNWLATKVRVTLWCEHSKTPVFQLEEQPWKVGSAGVYSFDLPKEWFVKLAPLARIIGRTLGVSVRVATAGLATGVDVGTYATELGFGEKTVESLAKVVDYTDAWRQGTGGGPKGADEDESRLAEGAALRVLHDFLRKQDPTYGGLERVWDQQYNRYIWVHRRYRDIYEPRLRGLADD